MAHANAISLLACFLVLLASGASAVTYEHTLNVGQRTIRRACGKQIKTVVNGSVPGPLIRVREGDTLIVHVLNNSPYNMTIHWHGVFQRFTAWADGPAYITQCPIAPATNFTQAFNLTGQEGTLWWHAHISALRETVYGALVIRPTKGRKYPFATQPDKEVPILLGEWFNANVVDLEHEFITNGGTPNLSDAFTINGEVGDFYPCPKSFTLNVVQGNTYLLRMINAVMHDHMFFKIAGHTFTVVSVDADYIEPYTTDVIVLAPGQSADVLMVADQPIGNYYMASRPYQPTASLAFSNGTTTATVHYEGAATSTPILPELPGFNDTETAHRFYSNVTSVTDLTRNPHWVPVPQNVDESMFITFGLALEPCGANLTCANPAAISQYRLSSTMNNISFLLPTSISIMEAYRNGTEGIYTEDFPNSPPLAFDYTSPSNTFNLPLIVIPGKQTRVKRLSYNSVVDVVLQNTVLLGAENHPIHFHGFSFYVLAQGFGNFDEVNDPSTYNLINPQKRNTIAVPIGGWATIRFVANNPGVWFVHCHRETHVPWGLDMAFIIEDGPTPSTSLPPPPSDLPRC